MKLYSDLTGRRTAQVLADLVVLFWVSFWGYAGRRVHDAILALHGPADGLRDTGASLSQSMSDASAAVHGVPLVGDELTGPFDQAADAGTSMARLGSDLGVGIDRLSVMLGLVTALLPIVLVVGIWAVLRIRFVRRATAARRFVDAEADLDLFALRAMSRQPMHRLARISDDPAGAWRRQESDVVRELALLELRTCGLRLSSELG